MQLNRAWRERFSRSGSAAAKSGRYLVLGLAALGGLGMVWHFLFGSPTDVADPARTVVNKAAVVSSLAEDFVSVWLTATSSDTSSLAQFVTVPGDLKLPPTPAVVITAPTVVAVTYEGDAGKGGVAELYSVVVGVTQRAYESAPPTRAVYQVAALWSPKNGPRAVGMPARVGGPGPGADLPARYPTTLGPSDSAFTVVGGFVTAYLTSAGGVDRYVTSDSLLAGLGDAYQSATVSKVAASEAAPDKPAEGQTVRVLADVDATTSQYALVELAYPLTLRGVGGKWQVAAIDHAPAMSNGDDPVPVVAESPK